MRFVFLFVLLLSQARAGVALPTYGTGWTASAMADWRSDTPSGGQFLWNIAGNLATQTTRWRTGTVRVSVVGLTNAPVVGATVQISQVDHAFPIMSTFNPGMVIDDPTCMTSIYAGLAFTNFNGGGGFSGPISAAERAQVRALYKTWGINSWKNESGFLESLWEGVFNVSNGYLGEAKGPSITAMDWMKNRTGKVWRGFDGHSLHYPLAAIYINPPYGTTVSAHSTYWHDTHLLDIVANTANWGMTTWSLVNEVSDSWYTVGSKYDDPLLITNLQYARPLFKGPVYVNGYLGVAQVRTQAEYFIAQGIPVDELAQQWHRGNGSRTQQQYCDEVTAFNFKSDSSVAPWNFNISEYDSTFTDPADRATDLELALRACFANPACSHFCMFSFWEPTSWISAKWGLVKRDMTNSTVGDKLQALFYSEWWTGVVSSTTNGSGYHDFTGAYFGSYDVTVTTGGHTATKRFEVAPSMPEVVAIVDGNGLITFSR